MSLLDYLLRRPKRSAAAAKDRLQIILAREHSDRDGPDYLPAMKREILEVVCRYVKVDLDDINVNLERDGDTEILELNITLPEPEQPVQRAAAR